MAFGVNMQARSEIAAEREMHPFKHRDSDGAPRRSLKRRAIESNPAMEPRRTVIQ